MIHLNDPIIGQTHTKVGETHTHTTQDPIVGQTHTKVGETVTTVNDYGTSYINPDYATYTNHYPATYYSSSYVRRAPLYTRFYNNSASEVAGTLLIGTFLICALAAISLAPSRGYRYSSNFGQNFKKCDIVETCNLHASGAKSGCYNVERNCHWIRYNTFSQTRSIKDLSETKMKLESTF